MAMFDYWREHHFILRQTNTTMDNPQLVDASCLVFQMVACRIAVSDRQMVKMVCVVYIYIYTPLYIIYIILYI